MRARWPVGPTRALGLAFAALTVAACGGGNHDIVNRYPVRLLRPPATPLSEMAVLGRAVFFDSTLSASGRMSCASCHDPARAYASDRVVPPLGRAVPSLRYVDRTPNFAIRGTAADPDEPPLTPADSGGRAPSGGLFWDGRVNTLQTQAMGPLLNAEEMGNHDIVSAARSIRRAPYARSFAALLGADVLASPNRLVDEAMFAVARFEIEDSSFHPYASKYDAFLEGREALAPAEWRGAQAFDDPTRGNCAACHLDRPTPDGRPPALTDYEYEALGVPRAAGGTAGRAPSDAGYDLGLCGPFRSDLRADAGDCGSFRTPSLRNTATRSRFFHNGVYRSLEQVLAFYDFRDVSPERIYPRDARGAVLEFNDLPARYRRNVDVRDAPFGRAPGTSPALTPQEMRDVIAFLKTLSDR
ncbi:MAG TPA: cytochrome c peroxidase [Gemmatimonadaceae bacterium]|nr:cytochrome c peroxidase [Gemmatimonadaceae bacterium]